MLSLDFYYQAPIDFEHKNYLLLSYLSELDIAFSEHHLSPYLLWTEKLIMELNNFDKILASFESSLKKEIISFNPIIYSKIENKEIKEIYEIVDYSKPLLESKIKIGYKLFNKYPQLLY